MFFDACMFSNGCYSVKFSLRSSTFGIQQANILLLNIYLTELQPFENMRALEKQICEVVQFLKLAQKSVSLSMLLGVSIKS